MSRNKKSRSGGSNADVVVVRNRTQSDVEGRLRKKDKKRKGLKTGNRNSDSQESNGYVSGQKRDPRLGSKKKIPLVVEVNKKPNKAARRASAEQELEMLENDAQLGVLLDRLEQGENLGAGLQKYVDEKLERIEILMKQLGIYEEDSEQIEEEIDVDDVVPTKVAAKKPATDEELLSQFAGLDLNQLKD
ncbi:Der GTPase-activating protein YihI [Vibrio ostreicida]|uniref:Der GTPase-activating protein YihI n=1 Tax=Vibrio ostreicida TaxID=526588 RepID=A0ABT8BNN6_9VIBR|nr:Der GTPase-activating protein YihI [Vibrio ostreicida]MDN3608700.1 Der GTPase-activating protein YihI [Vibrio ostreicida]NPD10617.1 GTPase-activating protein [Vibrio ostreicida]